MLKKQREEKMNAPVLQQLADAFAAIPFNQLLGLQLEEFQKEEITLRFEMKKDLIGNYLHGILHGGVISSVLDMAGGAAAMVSVVKKSPQQSMEELTNILSKSSTINLNINYIRPGKGEHFLAKSKVLQTGQRICFTRMELYNHEEILIASGQGTYLVG